MVACLSRRNKFSGKKLSRIKEMMNIMVVSRTAVILFVALITSWLGINFEKIEKAICSSCITRYVIAIGNRNPILVRQLKEEKAWVASAYKYLD